MLNIILSIFAGLLVGWNLHAFFIQLKQPTILKKEFTQLLQEVNKSSNIERNSSTQKIIKKDIIVEKNISISKDINASRKAKAPFYSLIEQNLFSDALSLYRESQSKQQSIYRVYLKSFFQDKIINNREEAIIQLNEYLVTEPDNIETKLQLIEAYQREEKYDQAIHLLIKLLEESSSPEEQEQYTKEIISLSQTYIDKLNREKNSQQLTAFLKEHIEYGLNTPFYTFILAKHYIEEQEYLTAIELLKEIEYDEEFGERAKTLLKQLAETKFDNEQYTYKIPLTKDKEHFYIDVTIEGTPFHLLLDTGATYTLIDNTQLPPLKTLEEGLTLNTASGDISGNLEEAKSFKIKELELKNFQVTTTSFKGEGSGLLGMNFFKLFKFKIDQTEGILYLVEKG